MIKAMVFPTNDIVRVKYSNDKELDDILKALGGVKGLDLIRVKYGK